MNRAILIFSKVPKLGTVKTRMRPLLNDAQCLSLHIALLKDTIAKCRLVETDVILYLSGKTEIGFDSPIPVEQQEGPDLGARLLNAFTKNLRKYRKVVIVGTDSPLFPPQSIDNAFTALESSDVALGPCDDGGYYLIAMNEVFPKLFEEIAWGTSDVLESTLKKGQDLRLHLMPPDYDVDRPDDLIRLRGDVAASEAAYLEHLRIWFAHHKDAIGP